MSLLFLVIFIVVSLLCLSSLSLLLSDVSTISKLKDIIEIIEKITTLVAILIGGLWTYWLFIKNRQRYPRAEIINTVHQFSASGNSNILRLDLVVRNIGNVLIQIDEIGIVVSQIQPIPKSVAVQLRKNGDPIPDGETEYSWDQIAGRSMKYDYHENEIEPGESQSYQFDFHINADVKKVEIYSSVYNISKPSKQLAWDWATIVEIA